MEQLIEEDHSTFRGFVDLGSCLLHTVHNAFGKGVEELGEGEIPQMIIDLHSIFKHNAARSEDYRVIQEEMDNACAPFLYHSSVCWLSLRPAIERLPRNGSPFASTLRD